MNLVVDIGNSFIKIAVFKEDTILYSKYHKTFHVKDLKVLRKKYPFSRAIASSVRQNNPYFIQHLLKNYNLLLLDHKTKVPIKNMYKTPSTLGFDRLAAVVGGNHLYAKKNVLVIDIGTCMTFDYIDKAGNYLGGNISPGIEVRLKSMNEYTSSLPLVKRSNNQDILGKTTKSALQNGAVKGIKYEIESFIKTLTKKMGHLTVILTGGDALYFGELIESKIFVDPKLVLKGLNEILKYNS